MIGRERKVRERLSEAIAAARGEDDAVHAAREQTVAQRNAEIELAKRVVARDPDALFSALEEHSSLGDLPFAVEGIDTLFIDNRIVAIVDGLDVEDIPEESASLLKSGKASFKAIPLGKRHELHRDALCSAAVRVALEFLTVLPLDFVEVLMLTDILDRATGHINAAPVLHLSLSEQAASTINFERADGFALVERLGGHMDWTKREGFRAINAAAFGIELSN
ncbi:hypothetical protein [Novosphingobium sp. PASSN1]|uniref:hypothetical protein n=1 Tax=Novosphingobium sp. PASSN1 TaxID=2015561 RepID=UPI000BD7521B|nr:hypothetical protein [Novosphingobium sp. PASSN1]OYU37305.1 MAG: hypothetical protein CFE35_02800 [Novosphingobium sp. PASSN1]